MITIRICRLAKISLIKGELRFRNQKMRRILLLKPLLVEISAISRAGVLFLLVPRARIKGPLILFGEAEKKAHFYTRRLTVNVLFCFVLSCFFVFCFFFFNCASISDSLNGSAHIGTEISRQRKHTFLNLCRI